MHCLRRIDVFAAAVCVLGGAVWLLPGSSAFSTAGHTLGLNQRDVRLFNNFQDLSANDAIIEHPNWPGFTGAAVAIWKGAAEWGSLAHGDGTGDPTQPQVGSGGANFDATWQGYAPGVGSLTDNVISTFYASGGIVSMVEMVGATGWRIRFNEFYVWEDDPAGLGPGLDIQGLFTHEYGHALGLGHSTVNGSTMFSSVSGTGIASRSIEPDDIAGVQFLYGVAAATKPIITGVSVINSVLTVTGQNFAAQNNEVWFTRLYENPSGDPVVVSGLASTGGGSSIVLALPPDAGPGDVLVRVPGTSGAALSNAYPIDLPGCHASFVYCQAKLNSLGCTPSISGAGVPSASSGSGLVLSVSQVLNQVNGLFFYSTVGPAQSPFLGGLLCASPPLQRMGIGNSGGNPSAPASDCSGVFSADFNAWVASSGDPALVAGADVWVQHWSRDPGDPFTVSLSAAVTFALCP